MSEEQHSLVARPQLDPLTRRNTETVEQALRDLEAKISKLHDRIVVQDRVIASVVGRLADYEQQRAATLAASAGRGPTAE